MVSMLCAPPILPLHARKKRGIACSTGALALLVNNARNIGVVARTHLSLGAAPFTPHPLFSYKSP
jgi:hypothetical protein